MKHMKTKAGAPRYCGATDGQDATLTEQIVYMYGWDKKSPDICQACKDACFKSMVIEAGPLVQEKLP